MLFLLAMYICKSIVPFLKLKDDQKRVEGLFLSPNNKKHSLLTWSFKIMPSDSELQQREIEDNVNLDGIYSVSLSTIDGVLQCNRLALDKWYNKCTI